MKFFLTFYYLFVYPELGRELELLAIFIKPALPENLKRAGFV
jgi:hypothetical protein